MQLQQHPLSAAFPSIADVDLDALAEDIKKHGQRERGTLLKGMVLDGWHRYLACERLGIPFTASEFDGEDPVAFVLSRNLHRRHLTASQRAAAVVACHNWRPAGKSRGAELHGVTKAEMADEAQVSERTIVHAKQAHQAGLSEAVKSGQVSVERAAEIAKLPPRQREKALKSPPKPRVIVAGAKVEAEYTALKEKYEETLEKLEAMTDLAESAEAFKEQREFKEMQVLRVELKSAKRRRDELMRENAELKKQVSFWKKKAEKA